MKKESITELIKPGHEISELKTRVNDIESILLKSDLKWDIEYRPDEKYYVIRVGEKK